MEFRVENGEVFLKKWWFSKEISLKNVTHVIRTVLADEYYEGDKKVYQCQRVEKTLLLLRAVFEQSNFQYYEWKFDNPSYELINLSEHEEYLKSNENKVQAIIEEHNAKHKVKFKYDLKFDDNTGIHSYFFSRANDDEVIFKAGPTMLIKLCKNDHSQNVICKLNDEDWESDIKDLLKCLNKSIMKEESNNKKKFLAVLKYISAVILFGWNIYTSYWRPYIFVGLYYCFTGKICELDAAITIEEALETGWWILIPWLLFVTLPLIILLVVLRKINKKFVWFAIGSMVLVGVVTCCIYKWDFVRYLV